jgi:hypothetical protein
MHGMRSRRPYGWGSGVGKALVARRPLLASPPIPPTDKRGKSRSCHGATNEGDTISMISKKVLVMSAFACLLAFNVTTASADDSGDCRNLSNDLSPDQVIGSCNRAIRNTGGGSTPVVLFVWRSIAYKAKGELDRSLADLDQALKLGASDKGSAAIYNLRGVLFQMKGDNGKAEADFAKAREFGN